ncbi:hypothetical protein MMC21_008028 [Puttea exsequens]|nr:hypothetical protein [Puttea exsequens]
MRPALNRPQSSRLALCLLCHLIDSVPKRLIATPHTQTRCHSRRWEAARRHERFAHSRGAVCLQQGPRRIIESPRIALHNDSIPDVDLIELLGPSDHVEQTAAENTTERHSSGQKETPGQLEHYLKESNGQNYKISHAQQEKEEPWRTQLLTFEQYQYESNVGGRPSRGSRLVDNEKYAEDWALWLELARFSRRNYGIDGTRKIFRAVIKRGIHLPTDGATGEELWELMLQSGLAGLADKKEAWMKAIVSYATGLEESTGHYWAGLYRSMVGYTLAAHPAMAWKWHLRLAKHFKPRLEDYRHLFQISLLGNSLNAFMAIYKFHPLLGMYAHIVPELCRLKMYQGADEWHRVLCKNRDLPRDFKDFKPLLKYLQRLGPNPRSQQLLEGLRDALVAESSSLLDDFDRQTGAEILTREAMNEQLGEAHGVSPKILSDRFCARLFATKYVSVEMIISGLQMLGLQTLGPLSLRELAAKDKCHPKIFMNHLVALREAGVIIEKSPFSRVLEKLAQEGRGSILRSVVQCDLHPDAFSDLKLQERLLAIYISTKQPLRIERTLAVIAYHSEQDSEQEVCRWNALLRTYSTLKRLDDVRSTIEHMQRKDISITAASSLHLRRCLLSYRQVCSRAHNSDNLTILINASQLSLQRGESIPIIAWREILRRLGMAGRLVELENLALWLVDHYTNPTVLQTINARRMVSERIAPTGWTARMLANNTDQLGFLRILFTTSFVHAVVKWGFQHEVRTHFPTHSLKEFKANPTHPRDDQTPWTWGLLLLLKLQKRGVPLQKYDVASVCRQCLSLLFGARRTQRQINRVVRMLNYLRARSLPGYARMDYVREMRRLWGGDLFTYETRPPLKGNFEYKSYYHKDGEEAAGR